MSKKRYRIYKAGGEQDQSMNPMSQFLERAQMGKEYQRSPEQQVPEEMSMMEQEQGMPMAEDLMSDIKQSLEEGVELEDILVEKVKEGVELNDLGQVLAEMGIPEQAIVEAFQYVQRLMAPAQEQPSEEDMAAMQQEQMSQEEQPPMEQPPMSRGGYIKLKLKEAQEGMSVDKSNLNLAAENDVNNVSNLLKFTQDNNMTNQFGQEYDMMANQETMPDQEMMPEARLGREARRERRQERRSDRREDRQERRDERRSDRDVRQAERMADREGRQAQRAYRQAYRNTSVPFGYNPPMIGAGMGAGFNPMMSGNMIFEGERGLFGRLKNYKIQIDGLGFPANYTRGLYKQGLTNPNYIRQDYFRKQLPGEVMGSNTKPRNPNSDNNENPDTKSIAAGSTDGGKSEGTATGDNNKGGATPVSTAAENSTNPEGFVEKVEVDKKFDNLGDTKIVETNSGEKIVVPNTNNDKGIGMDDFIDWTIYGIGTVAVLDVLVNARNYRKMKKAGLSDKQIAKKATEEGAEKLSEKTVTQTSKAQEWLKGRKSSRDPLSGRFQKKASTIPQYAKQKTSNLAKSVYKPARNIARKAPSFGRNVLKALSRGRIKEDGGFVDSMDEMYDNPDLYRFTGGGDPGFADYFADGGYYEDGGEYEPFKSTYQGPLTEADQTSLDNQYVTTAIPEIPFAPATKPNYRTIRSDEEAQENEAYRRKLFENYARSGSSNVAFASNRGNKSVGYTGYNDNTLRDAKYYADTDMNSKEGQILKTRDDMEYYIDNNLLDTVDPNKDEKYLEYRKKLSTLRSQAYGGSAQPQYKNVYDPYMPDMEYGGIQYAAPGAVVDPGYNKEDTEKDLIEGETNYKDQYGKDARSLFEGIMANPDQKAAMMAMYKKQQGAGTGTGGTGQGGMFLSSPYGNGRGYGNRRGFMNSVMGYNRPAAFQKTGQWLSPYSNSMNSIRNQSYKSGLPMLEGIPGDANLTQVEVVKRNMFDRLFPGKDEDGNRNPRGPRKSIKYTFNQPGSSAPGLDTKDNKISNFKIDPRPDFDESGGNEIEEERIIDEGSENQDGLNTISIEEQIEKDAANSRGAAAAMRTKGDDRRDRRDKNKADRLKNRQERQTDRTFRKIGRRANRFYGNDEPSTQEGKDRMNQQAPGFTSEMEDNLERDAMMGYAYGGFQEGEVYDLTEAEIGAIMAAGGQIEFI